MRTVLITGTSRGLGLGLTKAYLKRGDRVLAVTRKSPENELLDLWLRYGDALKPIACDLNDEDSTEQIQQALKGIELDLSLFNAGIYGPLHQDPQRANLDEIAQIFMSNAIAPVRLAKTLRPNMAASGVFAFMSSQMASVELARAAQMALYGASKAALNSLLRNWCQTAPELCILALHPGWVRTDMGGDDATLSIEESVTGLVSLIDKQAGQPGCRFLDYQEFTLPW